MHLSARESVELLAAAQAAGVAASGEVTPHHLCLTDEAVRSLDPNLKMNPPLRTDARPRGADRGARATARSPRSRPTTRRTRARRRTCPFEAAPFGVTGLETAFAALYTTLVEPGLLDARDAARADVGRAGAHLRPRAAADRGRRAARTSSLLDTEATWQVREDAVPLALGELVAARPSGCRARSLLTVAAGRIAYEA